MGPSRPPQRHTGERVFFSARVRNRFPPEANRLALSFEERAARQSLVKLSNRGADVGIGVSFALRA